MSTWEKGQKYKTHAGYKKEWVELSKTATVDAANEDDFLIDMALLMKDNEEYQGLLTEKNFGREQKTEDQKVVNGADNVYTVKHFIQDNFEEIKNNRVLQKEIKVKLERLKKLVEAGTTEWAQLQLLEFQIGDMLSEDIEE